MSIKNAVFAWMDGSLFFRAVSRALDFLHRLFKGSFFIGFISAEYDNERLGESVFARLTYGALNIFPKILRPKPGTPDKPPEITNRNVFLSGSAVFSGLNAALGGGGFTAAIPTAGLLLAAAGAPFLPTMLFAGVLSVTLLFALFRYNFEPDLTGVCLVFFIVITLFAGVTSFAPGAAIRAALLTSVIMSSYLLVRTCLTGRRQTELFLAAFTVSAFAAGCVGVFQFLTNKKDMTWVDKDLFSGLGLRVYSTFANPNVYGAYLLLAIPCAAAMALYAKNIIFKLLAAAAAVLLTVNLMLSYSRGCYLALAVAALVFVLLTEKRLVVLFSAGLVVLPFILPPTVINRLLSITNLSDSSTEFRLYIWQGTLKMLKTFWLSGVGPGTEAFNTIYPFYAFNSATAAHSHNLFLQIFSETGVAGLLVFFAVLAAFFRNQVCFMRRAPRRDKLVSAAMTAAVTGFLFQGLFDYVFYNFKVMLAFYIFLGLASAFTRTGPQEAAGRD